DLVAAIGIEFIVPVQAGAGVPCNGGTRTLGFQGRAGIVGPAADDGLAEHTVRRLDVAIMVIGGAYVELGNGMIRSIFVILLKVSLRCRPVARHDFVEAFTAYAFN